MNMGSQGPDREGKKIPLRGVVDSHSDGYYSETTMKISSPRNST
jgi:hypothetical protein